MFRFVRVLRTYSTKRDNIRRSCGRLRYKIAPFFWFYKNRKSCVDLLWAISWIYFRLLVINLKRTVLLFSVSKYSSCVDKELARSALGDGKYTSGFTPLLKVWWLIRIFIISADQREIDFLATLRARMYGPMAHKVQVSFCKMCNFWRLPCHQTPHMKIALFY